MDKTKRKKIKCKVTIKNLESLIWFEEDKENYYLVIDKPLNKLLGKSFILDIPNIPKKS